MIDLDSIYLNKSAKNFSSQEILYLANSIAKIEGIIRIPIVKRLNIEEYELISGYLEYYSYQKAREINSELPDRIRVFISENKTSSLINEQIEIFSSLDKEAKNIAKNDIDNNKLSIDIKNLISAVESIKTDIDDSAKKTRKEVVNTINEKLPKPIPPLVAFNQIQDPQVAELLSRKLVVLQKHRRQYMIKRLQDFKAKNPNHKFNNFSDVLDILEKGWVSKEKMLDIIDSWNSI